jgi:hypothetical protein
MTTPKVMHRTLAQIFVAPLLVAVLSALGLISALVGDGWWDVASWIALGIPLGLYLVFIWQRKPS